MASEKIMGLWAIVVGITGNAGSCWKRVPTIT